MRPLRTIALSALACALLTSQTRAASSLTDADSADMQRLLATQNVKLAVNFEDQTIQHIPNSTYDRLFLWNEIGLDTTAIDHTPVPPGQHRIFGEQFGPARTSRALAITNIAMFEAVNAVYQKYHSYTGLKPVTGTVSVDIAIARAAHDTLVWLYPSQGGRLDRLFAQEKGLIAATQAAVAGEALGIAAAKSIIALRTDDGSGLKDPQIGVEYFPKKGPGYWSIDPVSHSKVALGAFWGHVKPFVMMSGSQFRPPPPPSLTSDTYTTAYNAVKSIGGDPAHGTPTTRTARETLMGIYWTYDGMPAICAPARLYNQIARSLAFQQGLSSVEDAARYLAIVNTSLADAAISGWDGKYYYQYWRPVTAIRDATVAGNPNIKPDPNWYPLGGQATNTHGPNFTPPFPSYPSGHAVFGGALFEMLRHFWPDHTPFTFISDEFNGHNYNDLGQRQKLHPLSYSTFKDAEWDNAESRIWIGVHWQFDADVGIKEGNQVADWVYENAFTPVAQ
jgi:membrane-associated phospholipid phosphatase